MSDRRVRVASVFLGDFGPAVRPEDFDLEDFAAISKK